MMADSAHMVKPDKPWLPSLRQAPAAPEQGAILAGVADLLIVGRYQAAVGHFDGGRIVIMPGREYQEVARSTLEPFTSTPVFSGNRMYVRGQANLYCIGNK
jgi:hypothetical protein